jgi:hypothetical protein
MAIGSGIMGDCKIPADAAWQEARSAALENVSRETLCRVSFYNVMLLKQTYFENFPVDTVMYRKNNERASFWLFTRRFTEI